MNRAKVKSGLCDHYHCTAAHAPKDRYCPKHRKRHDKTNDPARYTYNFLKANARRSRLPFEITLQEFRELGTTKTKLINKPLGYIAGNLITL